MHTPRLRTPVATLLALLLAFAPAFSQSPSQDEVLRLHEENQRLRQLLLQREAATPSVPAAVPNAPSSVPSTVQAQPAADQPKALDHWLTLSSGKRHNSTCCYFHASKGRACTADEGIPCKICGG